LQVPSGDRAPICDNTTMQLGVGMTLTPPAMATSQSPVCSARTAWCIATSDDEHTVFTAIAGPRRPSAYATRPARTTGRCR
jgi:hypothetical protein